MTGYHHGDLRAALLREAATMAAERGPDAVTLRALARRTGVTHSAPVHHFGTRQALLTELAAEGFASLVACITANAGDLHEMGVAYIAWALAHPGHYVVMWQPRLLDESHGRLVSSRAEAWRQLATAASAHAAARSGEPDEARALAAFALVHGLASIWLSGALTPPDNPAALARAVAQRLALGADGR